MAERPFNVLFLCASNSVRSIIAESVLNHAGKGHFRGFSAGSTPAGRVDPFLLELLAREGLPTSELRSKSWDEFAGPDEQPMDFVITLCDTAAGEACPVWPGHPVTAHWGIDDPDRVGDSLSARHRAIESALRQINHRVQLFVSLPFAQLDSLSLQHSLDDIGRIEPQSH